MSNPIEIVTTALGRALIQAGKTDKETPWSAIAIAIIAALEKEGAKVMWREPTEEMIRRMNLAGFNASIRKVSTDVFHAAHDAAPRYGEPS